MNIKPEFTTSERPNAVEAMEYAMDYFFKPTEPKKDELTETDRYNLPKIILKTWLRKLKLLPKPRRYF